MFKYLRSIPCSLPRVSLLGFFLFSLFLVEHIRGQAFAQETELEISSSSREKTPLLGGEFIDPAGTALAFISTADGICSGLLVGKREVLTAAHCLEESNARLYVVRIDNRNYAVSQIFINSSYNPNSTALSALQHDLGLIILSRDVTSVPPIPVVTREPIAVGDRIIVYGFGLNEIARRTEADYFSNVKVGQQTILSIRSGVFITEFSSGSVVCSGDSGGPVIKFKGGQARIVGVVSAGTTRDSRATCLGTSDDESVYVDLQSFSSRRFLSSHSRIRFTDSLPDSNTSKQARILSNLFKVVSAAIQQQSFTALQEKTSRAILISLRLRTELLKRNDWDRIRGHFRMGVNSLRRARRSRNIDEAQILLQNALGSFASLE